MVRSGQFFCQVSGSFYRAVNPAHQVAALSGSQQPGRYSPPHVPTLYLSSSVEGVQAAMIANRDERSPQLHIIEVEVQADQILDLRDEAACRLAGVKRADATAPWQEVVAQGGQPRPWAVRRRLDVLGAHGVIDPSRKQPGLWHLALFQWNSEGAPQVRVSW